MHFRYLLRLLNKYKNKTQRKFNIFRCHMAYKFSLNLHPIFLTQNDFVCRCYLLEKRCNQQQMRTQYVMFFILFSLFFFINSFLCCNELKITEKNGKQRHTSLVLVCEQETLSLQREEKKLRNMSNNG